MFKFHKLVLASDRQFILSRIEESLRVISTDTEITPERVSFKIGYFSPIIRYSRFVAFSRVVVTMHNEDFTLELIPSAALLFPFAIASVAYVAFLTIGPISTSATVLIFSVPTVVGLIATGESLCRTFLWWRTL